MYKSKFYNAKETKQILEKGSPDVFIKVYHKERKGSNYHPKDEIMKKPTLSQRLDELIKAMNARFDNLEKDVKNINIRLDRVERRLDYNSLQIEEIQKRLDYNGLKKLDTNR